MCDVEVKITFEGKLLFSFEGGPKSGDGGVWEEIPGGRNPCLGKETQGKQRNVSFIQEYVREERLEVPVEFDEGINNLLKKIEVIIMIMVIMGILPIC